MLNISSKTVPKIDRGVSTDVDVALWMRANRLQLNTNKTDLLWCSTARRLYQLPSTALRVGSDFVKPSTCVRDLGIFIDADLTMRTQVRRTVAGSFAAP